MGPEYMTEAIDEDADGLAPDAVDAVLDMARDVIAIGPGLGQATGTRRFITTLVDRATVPLVIDADGLNAFSASPGALVGREGRDVIITPHPGEMARLVGISNHEVQANRLAIAREFATSHHLYVMLKGHRTLVATPDGKVFINPTGNPGMATGGTGDVLCGMIAAWLAQLLDAEAACKLAVYLHGLAGDLAEADCGDAPMTAVRRGAAPERRFHGADRTPQDRRERVSRIFQTASEAETMAAGRELAATLEAGAVVSALGRSRGREDRVRARHRRGARHRPGRSQQPHLHADPGVPRRTAAAPPRRSLSAEARSKWTTSGWRS